MNPIDKDEIVRLTEAYGGQWGINHTRRLLHLISIISEGQNYDSEVVWIAAHLHDWGGYSKWQQAGVDHALRSKQVVEAFWAERDYPQELLQPILECIELHHSGDPGRRIEAILLSDADALDFLGVVGVLRDFSKKPSELRKAYEVTQGRKEKLPRLICLDKAKVMAEKRLRDMDELLSLFEQDTFGYF